MISVTGGTMTRKKLSITAGQAAGTAAHIRCLGLLVVLVAAVSFGGCKESYAQVELDMPELAAVADGTYRGTASVPPVIARVEVSVTNATITSFRVLRHLTGQGQAAEALAEKVVEEQTIELDAVSGATYSSKAILKAGEKALRRGLQR
jgi:uncharacterized protein with FMN-binding domain